MQTNQVSPLIPGREQVLARLWQIANLSAEMTRGSINGQVKALAMIVAMEGLIPDRRAGTSETKTVPQPAPPPTPPAAEADEPATTTPTESNPPEFVRETNGSLPHKNGDFNRYR